MKYLPLLIIVFIVACGSSKEEELQSLKNEVMAIHDEVMPKMGLLRAVRLDIMARVETIQEAYPDSAANLTLYANQLDDANEAMMDWMRNYEPDFEGNEEQTKEYLEGQKVAIQKVKDDMLNSFEEGRTVLGIYED